ncbi:MAG: alpha-L-fucosidase [Schaalia hyovaginalis]|uniref:alpha-L-fucosidase n=1 Tax=Schaalia TaxID=2529408 RepID=UPI0026EA6300|nr:alpha-L-fucosidase [Schaalia hyovaginalis]MCI7512063.1 alpha-L-fucosidase [Schaalia hyovaginalis]MDY4262847.1 alpha-L-fucosidase [Schaalia hyovaginalis]
MSRSSAADRRADHRWFDEARFGLFVHFGLYSVAARHEWVMTRERRTVEDYERYAEFFEPDLFDASKIATLAKSAGMGYAVLTTKHHDGFCMWDSRFTTYTSMHHQHRDFVREWVDALRAAGLKVGLYHSLLDWHHPDFPYDFHHPRRDDADARDAHPERTMAEYRTYLHNQVRELLTNYGTIDYLFFDFSYPWESDGWKGKGKEDWGSDELLAMVRELQPGIIVNDRLDIPADLVTPEQYQPSAPMEIDGERVRWEACQTLNGSWGYDRDNLDFKSTDLIVRMLSDTVSKGGNLLLNIGPDGRGAVSPVDEHTLAEVGEWMRLHRNAIVGADAAEGFTAPEGAVLTKRGDRLYIHLLHWPFGHLHLPDLAGKVRFARLLNDGSELKMTEFSPETVALTTEPGGQPAGTLTLELPVRRPDVLVPVIELYLSPDALR